jgi:DNA polymerase-3 subunit delta
MAASDARSRSAAGGQTRAATVGRLTLVVGAEPVLVERAIASVMAAARAGATAVARVDLDAADEGAGAALRESLSPTLFGDTTVVVLSDVQDSDDQCAAILRESIRDLSEESWLVILHPGGVKGKALLEAVRAAGAAEVTAAPITRARDILDFLESEVAAHRRRMTRHALTSLHTAIGGDLPLLVSAVSQLMSDVDHDPIDETDVARYFEGVAEVSGFAIADAVWNQQPIEALRSLRWAEESGDDARIGPPTVGAIASALRGLVAFAGAPRGLSEVEVAKAAGVPPWKVRTLREQLPRWRPELLAAAAVRLATADAAVKGGLREGENLDPVQKMLVLERVVNDTARAGGSATERPSAR